VWWRITSRCDRPLLPSTHHLGLQAVVPVLLQGKSPQQVMTPAVADPSKLGYLKLYKMMLDMVRLPATHLMLHTRVFGH
jgi:hypothetical protein